MFSIKKIADLKARWSIGALVFLLPIFFVPGGFVTISQGKLILVAVLAAVAALSWLISALSDGTVRLPRSIVLFAAAFLPIAYVISAARTGWASSAVASGVAAQDTVTVACLWFSSLLLAALVCQSQRNVVVPLVRTLIASGAVLVVFQIVRFVFPEYSFGGAFPDQTITAAGSWHDLGILLGLFALFSLTLSQTRIAASRLWRGVFIAIGAVSFLLLIVVNMTDVWWIFAAAALVCAAFLWRSNTASRRPLVPAILGTMALAGIALGFSTTTLYEYFPARLQVTSFEVRPSWQGTLEVGRESLAGSGELLFGSGPNSFARNWAAHRPAGVNETQFWNLDFATGVGAIPTSFVTTGALGATAWLVLMLGFLIAAWRTLRALRSYEGAPIFVVALACAIAYLFAFSVVYVPGIGVLSLLFILLGIFIALPRAQEDNGVTLPLGIESPARSLMLALVVVGTGVVLIASITALRALASDVFVNHAAVVYNRTGNIEAAGQSIARSLVIRPSNDRSHRAAVELGVVNLAQLLQNPQTDEASRTKLQETLSQTIQHGLSAVALGGRDYQNWLLLAQLYQDLGGVGVEGAYEEAHKAYVRASEEHPTNPVPLFRLAQLEAARGVNAEALKYVDGAIALKSNFAAAHYLRSQVLARDGQLEDAAQAAAAAIQLVPGDALGWYNLGTILYLSADYQNAVAAFNEALVRQNDYANALFMGALALAELGQTEEAVQALERVAQLNPDDATVPAVITNIREGRAPFESAAEDAPIQ